MDWTGNSQAVMATLNASSHSDLSRDQYDYYATPRKAVTELLRLETFTSPIWECASGEDHIANVLRTYGYAVRSSDVVDRIGNEVLDFLGSDVKWGGDIITNPPFAKATEFIERALDVVTEGRKVAFLLRIQFLEGVKRHRLFQLHPPIRVWVASRNLRCARNGDFQNATGNASTYCWFVWQKGFTGSPSIGWFNH